MGLRLDEHSFWTFGAAEDYWRAAHSEEEAKPAAPSADEHDADLERFAHLMRPNG